MRTARLLTVSCSIQRGGSAQSPLNADHTSWMQTPLDTDPLDSDPPCEQNDTRLWKYYLAPNFVYGW